MLRLLVVSTDQDRGSQDLMLSKCSGSCPVVYLETVPYLLNTATARYRLDEIVQLPSLSREIYTAAAPQLYMDYVGIHLPGSVVCTEDRVGCRSKHMTTFMRIPF